MSSKFGYLPATLILSGVLVAPDLHAQAPVDEEATLEIAEVIVSARRRDERLQDVPLSITAVTSETITAAGIDDIAQLSSMTPGFHFETGGTRQSSQPRIRGMDINTANPTRQNASFYINGVYLPGSTQGLDFSEFERVEVIKGPQSALFGRQTFGGAVNFVTKQPTNDLAVDAAATFGANDLRELTGSVAGPLVDDRLFVRAHLRSYEYGGKYRNAVDGKRLGKQESLSGSAVVSLRLLDAFRLDLRHSRGEDEDGPPGLGMVGAADLNCGPFVTGGMRYYCGALPTNREYAMNNTIAPNAAGFEKFGFERDTETTSLTMTASLARHDITFTAARFDEHSEQINDLDFTGLPVAAMATLQDFEDTSLELRLASTGDGRLRYVAGVYWYDGQFDERVLGYAADLASVPPSVQPDSALAENISAYGSLSYEITDRLTASAELRYQEDEVTNIGGQGAARRTLSAKTDAWLPRVILDYKVTDDTMVYAVYSVGNKPQQFNANIAGRSQAQQDYIRDTYGVGIALDEEKLANYELGVKSSWLDRRLTANASLFYMDWQDQVTRRQVFAAPGDLNQINVVDNAGSSEIKGIELEGRFAVTPALVFDASFAYISAEYEKFNSANVQQVFGDADAAGKESPRFPKLQGALAATYSFALPGNWDAALRVDELYMGKRWTDEVNLAYAADFWRTNLRATASRGPFSVTAYVENLTDDDGLEMATRYRDITVPGNNFSFPFVRSEGRKWGVSLLYSL